MRYLVDDMFLAETGNPFKLIVSEGVAPVDSTTTDLLLTIINSFQPAQGQILSLDEIRKMNEAAKMFEKKHGVSNRFHYGGHGSVGDLYTLEDAHWSVLKKICEWRMPVMGSGWTRSAPTMIDLLESLSTEDPRDREESSNGVSEGERTSVQLELPMQNITPIGSGVE
jgi:hypothetical protein